MGFFPSVISGWRKLFVVDLSFDRLRMAKVVRGLLLICFLEFVFGYELHIHIYIYINNGNFCEMSKDYIIFEKLNYF